MTIAHSTGQRNGALSGTNPVKTAYNEGALSFWAASAATPDSALGGWLGNCGLMTPAFTGPVNGVLTANSYSGGATIQSTATVVQASLIVSAEDASATTTRPRILGSVGTSGADFIVSSTAFVANGQVSITSLTYAHT